MLSTFVSVGKLMFMDHIARQKHKSALDTYLPTRPVFPEVLKFFIKSPGLPVRAPNLPGNAFFGFFQKFFINFVIFERSKRKIKQEVDLVLLFELNSNGKRKYAKQSN